MAKLRFGDDLYYFIRKRLFELIDNIKKIEAMYFIGSGATFDCRKNGNTFTFNRNWAIAGTDGDNAYELFRAKSFLDKKWSNLIKTQQSDDENACILKKEIEGE